LGERQRGIVLGEQALDPAAHERGDGEQRGGGIRLDVRRPGH
jgi:hypothetical protein